MKISDDVRKGCSGDQLRRNNFSKSVIENLFMVKVGRLERTKSLLDEFMKVREAAEKTRTVFSIKITRIKYIRDRMGSGDLY